MSIASKFLLVLILFSSVFFLSCYTAHNKTGVESAMRRYDSLIRKLDADSISLLFTPDGNLGDIAVGRDSIKKFLSSFKNVRVLSQASTTESIALVGDTALQKGVYTQTDLLSEKDTVKVKGEFTAKWEWFRKEGWRIKMMTTKGTH